MEKTYKNFGETLDKFRVAADLSYDRLALALGIANSYTYSIINKRVKSAPSDKIIKLVANYFHVEPEYFYEYRLRRMLEFINDNREFLDHCEKESKKFGKDFPAPPKPKEPEPKKEKLKSQKEQKLNQPVK